MSKNEIKDITDTALWIAAYRAEESNRKDALFSDPLAQVLIGDFGAALATYTQGSRFTSWSVVIRTLIVDQFILNLINLGVDTILNLGAGLDTRPYRLPIGPDIKWIEIDFPQLINRKNNLLQTFKPNCHLERIALDLTSDNLRQSLFRDVSSKSKKVLILTEGVIPYLSNHDVRLLAQELHSFYNFEYWITEYYSPEILSFLRTPKRIKQMKNAPFLFYPDHWFNFFLEQGWKEEMTKYFGIESEKIGRTPPTPGWLKQKENSKQLEELVKFYLGYTIYSKT